MTEENKYITINLLMKTTVEIRKYDTQFFEEVGTSLINLPQLTQNLIPKQSQVNYLVRIRVESELNTTTKIQVVKPDTGVAELIQMIQKINVTLEMTHRYTEPTLCYRIYTRRQNLMECLWDVRQPVDLSWELMGDHKKK